MSKEIQQNKGNSALIIRPLVADDRSQWESLWREYLAFYETELPHEVYDSTFSRMLSGKDSEFHCKLAVLDGRPVGLVHYLFHRHGWSIENTCYLQDLYADPSVRGTGVGRALIEAVYKAADEHGATSTYWNTQHFNKTARVLYDRIAQLTPFLKYVRRK
ncbi:putative Acetyltransferase [Rhodobacterales bacterium HTCC2150]|nr:putative Acetyltransferase [Rhodobacterales bacterium HTCC2150] [Rhodobacteraceae bacterium HTCC2150]